ncbi:hypothetical protein [Gottfriedia solisilvae]|uniref:Uncharacterized protein n=1 Tax=Gottfriedia solisilvae TaxID=1516104 RepID=A0A8J3APC6_9BACI|nr:hypothetical protein [Gottfriedia solisilvae]GGI18492.1 hypothetical protein GCM10007380_43180 [Gottfriedia solisilvae]
MSLSDRNSRLVLVITLISVLIFLIKKTFSLVMSDYSHVYTGDAYPIGLDHLFSSALISNLIVVLILAIVYCYFEAQTYCHYPEGTLNNYINKANSCYKQLITSIKICFIITSIFFFLMISFPVINRSIVKIVVAVLIFIVVVISLSFTNWKIPLIYKLLKAIKRYIKASLNLTIIYYWFLALITLFAIVSILGIKSNLDTNVNIEFLEKTSEMHITYTDKTTDMFPVEISYKVNGKKQMIKDSDALIAGSKLELSEKRKFLLKDYKIKKEMYSDAKVLYTYKIDLKKQLREGKNDIEINFVINDFINDYEGKRKYTIWNSIIKNDEKVEITEKKFKFKIN